MYTKSYENVRADVRTGNDDQLARRVHLFNRLRSEGWTAVLWAERDVAPGTARKPLETNLTFHFGEETCPEDAWDGFEAFCPIFRLTQNLNCGMEPPAYLAIHDFFVVADTQWRDGAAFAHSPHGGAPHQWHPNFRGRLSLAGVAMSQAKARRLDRAGRQCSRALRVVLHPPRRLMWDVCRRYVRGLLAMFVWMKETGKAKYAPGGEGIARDLAAWEADAIFG